MMKKLTELKKRYNELKHDINIKKANGNLGKLVNLNTTFDESFDIFFDDKKLRKKYNAWNNEHDLPNFNISNEVLEEMLDNEDKNALCDFLEIEIDVLEEELKEFE